MNPLYIYFHGANKIELSGETHYTIRGCSYSPGQGQVSSSPLGEVVTETLNLVLENDTTSIYNVVLALEGYLEIARAGIIPRDHVYLRFYDGASYDFKSRIVSGSVRLGAKGLVDRDSGSQVLVLSITRLNYWAAPKKLLPGWDWGIDEPTVADAQLNGLESHQDSLTRCTIYIDGESLGGLPSPIDVKIGCTNTDGYDQITMAMRVIRDQRRTDVGYVEGEDLAAGGAGITKTSEVQVLDSGGHFGRFVWNSEAEVCLAIFSVPAADLPYYAGALHKAIVRLSNTFAYTDLWVSAKVLISGTPTMLAEGLRQLWPAGSKYQEIAPVVIPPELAGFDTYAVVDYAIYVQRVAGGACQLDIDYLYLAPAEAVRKLIPIGTAPAGGAGKYLIDSGLEEKTYYLNASGQAMVTHTGQGACFTAYPGYHHMIKIFLTGGGIGTFNVHVQLNVGLWYEPRQHAL